MSERHVILTGFMGTGKSTLAPRVADALQRSWYDLDAAIEQSTQQTLADIFAEQGEAAFRAYEYRTLQQLLTYPPAVIATGGGTWCDADCRALLQQSGACIVCLVAPLEVLWGRVNNTDRPKGKDRQAFVELWQAREPWYRMLRCQIDTGESSVQASAEGIVSQLQRTA